MMKRGTIFLLLLVVALGLLAAAAVSILHDGLSARAQPSALEAAIVFGIVMSLLAGFLAWVLIPQYDPKGRS